MNQIDPNFDWVTARAQCNPSEVLNMLERQVIADVEKRNSLRSELELQYAFKFATESTRAAFKVALVRGGEIIDSCVFSDTPNGIKVSYQSKDPVLGILTLSDDGNCVLRTGDQERSFWQFRKMVLDDLFFAAVPRWRP